MTGIITVQPLILQYYHLLPEHRYQEDAGEWSRRFRKALLKFKSAVAARYNEATLEHLLRSLDPDVRQATILALGMIGSIRVNQKIADRLHDEDATARQLAENALWSIWFRADSPENNKELQRLIQLDAQDSDPAEVLAGFDALIRESPSFAEAYNQRAIYHFRRGDYAKSISDCERVLRFNPYHFGALGGMARCFMKQNKFRAALRVYRRAHRINPNLDGIRESIESLERILGE